MWMEAYVDGSLLTWNPKSSGDSYFVRLKSKKHLTIAQRYATLKLPRIGRVFFMRLFICIPMLSAEVSREAEMPRSRSVYAETGRFRR